MRSRSRTSGRVVAENPARIIEPLRGVDGVSVHRQQLARGRNEIGLVVDEQYVRHSSALQRSCAYARILPKRTRRRRVTFDPPKDQMQNRTSMGAPNANHMAAWIRSFPAVAALFVVAIAAAALVGWGYHLAWLRSPAPNFGVMIPGSAAASGLLGLALLVGLGRPRSGASALRWLLELAAALIGVAALAEYALGIDLGIDRWPLPTSLDAVGGSAPGRMSVLEGICVMFLADRPFRRPNGGPAAAARPRAPLPSASESRAC